MSALERRVVTALTNDAITLAALGELIIETQDAIKAADDKAEEARTNALDPLHSPDAAKAREAMESTEFARDRLRTLLPRLEQHYEKVRQLEVKTRWIRSYEITKAKVDATAEELKALYPEFTNKLVDLLLRIRQVDAEARRVMAAKPGREPGEPYDGRRLLATELVARGLTYATVTLDGALVLPDFNHADKRAWPPYEVPFGVQYAEMVAGFIARPRGPA